MAKDGNVELRMGVDASGVVRGVAVAQGALGKLQTQLASMESMSGRAFSLSGMAGIGLSATAAAAALVGSVKAAADYGDQLDNMSQRTGVAVEELARLQYAAKGDHLRIIAGNTKSRSWRACSTPPSYPTPPRRRWARASATCRN